MEEQATERVRALLEEASSAHREFEIDELNGVRDEDWPAWYANYLLAHGLEGLVGRQIGEDDLTSLLRTCDELYQRDQIHYPWPEFYARLIIEGR